MRRPTCTARDGLIYDLAGTPYTIEEATMRAHIVTDLAIAHPGEAYSARLTDLIDAIHQASIQQQAFEVAA